MNEEFALQVEKVSTENLDNYMPKHLLNKQAAFAAKLNIIAAELEVSIEAGKGDFSEYKETAKQAKIDMKELMLRCDAAINEACSAKAEDEAPLREL
jgi:hypothetical protein